MISSASSVKLIPYTAGLTGQEIASIEPLVFEKRAERGDIISFEGEPADALYTVVSGVVKTYKTSAEGKEQIFRLVRPGETFNDSPVLGNDINLINAEAMGPVVLLGIKASDMKRIVETYPVVARNAIAIWLKGYSLLFPSWRIFFPQRYRPGCQDALQQAVADHPRMTQQEMASVIGTAREMVGRSLKKS